MRVRRARCYISLPVLVCALVAALISVPRLTSAQEQVVLSKEVATVSAFVGEVLARNRMVWTTVEAVGHPLFSGDKVVTNRGRAEVIFTDDSVLRLGMHTSLQVTEKEQERGILFRRKWIKRTIRLALGDLFFVFKPVAGKGTFIETPTMVAGIRGTGGFNVVLPNRTTQWALTEGHAIVRGVYEPVARMVVPDVSVAADALPPADPAYGYTEVMQAVDRALAAQLEAQLVVSEADQLEEEAAEAEEVARRSPAQVNRERAAERRVAADHARLRSVVAGCESRREAVVEAVVEAETMNDPASADRAREYLGRIDNASAEVLRILERQSRVGEAVSLSSADIRLVGGQLTLSSSEVHVGRAFGLVVDGLARAANMEARGDRADARNVVQFVEASEHMAREAGRLVEQAGAALLQGSPAAGGILQTVESAARTVFMAARVQDVGTMEGVPIEPVAQIAFLARGEAARVLMSGSAALLAGRNGDRATLQNALAETARATERMGRIGEHMSGVPGGGGYFQSVAVTHDLLNVAQQRASMAGEMRTEQERMEFMEREIVGHRGAQRENVQDLLVNEILETAAVLDVSTEEAAELILGAQLTPTIRQMISPYLP